MLEQLVRSGENRVSELSKPLAITAPAVTKHLRALEEARLIRRSRRGREHHIRANLKGMHEAFAWMEACAAGWTFRFQKLEALIAAEKDKGTRH